MGSSKLEGRRSGPKCHFLYCHLFRSSHLDQHGGSCTGSGDDGRKSLSLVHALPRFLKINQYTHCCLRIVHSSSLFWRIAKGSPLLGGYLSFPALGQKTHWHSGIKGQPAHLPEGGTNSVAQFVLQSFPVTSE